MSLYVAVSDSDLEAMYDNALADFALAHRYEHNAHLRVPIERVLDELRAAFNARELPVPYADPIAPAPPAAGRWAGEG